MPATVTPSAKSRKLSASSTFDSQYSNGQEKSLEKTSFPQLNAPVRSSSSTLAGTAWDVSDQVLRTVMNLAQFTPVPYMGTVAVVAYSIFNAVQGARDNQDTLKQLAYLACSTVQSVYETYEQLHGHPPPTSAAEAQSEAGAFSSDPTLNAHLEELIRTLKEIDEWIKSLASRNLLRRVVASRSDLNFIQDFKDRLKQVMDNFQLQSMITLRYSMSRIAAQQKAMEQEAEQRHKSTQQTLYTIHEEVKNQNQRKPTTLPQYTDSPISSEPSSPLSPSPSPLSRPKSTSPSSSSPLTSRNPFFPPNHNQRQSNNPFHQALPSATMIQGNITVQNISGDHHVISKVDNSKRENFGNVYNNSHQHIGLSRHLSIGGHNGGLGGTGTGYRGNGHSGHVGYGRWSSDDPDGDFEVDVDAHGDFGGPGMYGNFRGDWGGGRGGRGGRGAGTGVGFDGHMHPHGRHEYESDEEHALVLADQYRRGSGRGSGSGFRRSRTVSEGGHRSGSGYSSSGRGSSHDLYGYDEW
ncbi:hypothetical protein GYMLUDRAFT_42214 [Collybiopsis luxurians FD-317 M1]|uniref:Uncharacterized protein n=1 Tax=Collybiopsis luxurians FD-317 M1 TaxID=944289 RepID=A0A0D0CHY6_9AGAR|nr:hypothetical protein GYMLUDRAFT_42214 [Collybiopsis luxurians FD-317 M1]